MDEPKLFSGIKFSTGQCHDVDDIKAKLEDGGATLINYLSEQVTHFIADRNCPKAEEARDLYDKPVVRSLWVHLCLKANKLLPTEAFSPSKNIFTHVVATLSPDLSTRDVETLAATLTFNGARVTKDVSISTHFITPSSNPQDLEEKVSLNPELRIVAPDWILDSIQKGQCCDDHLYDPALLLPKPPPTPSPPAPPPPPPLVEQSFEESKPALSDSPSSRPPTSESQVQENKIDIVYQPIQRPGQSPIRQPPIVSTPNQTRPQVYGRGNVVYSQPRVQAPTSQQIPIRYNAWTPTQQPIQVQNNEQLQIHSQPQAPMHQAQRLPSQPRPQIQIHNQYQMQARPQIQGQHRMPPQSPNQPSILQQPRMQSCPVSTPNQPRPQVYGRGNVVYSQPRVQAPTSQQIPIRYNAWTPTQQPIQVQNNEQLQIHSQPQAPMHQAQRLPSQPRPQIQIHNQYQMQARPQIQGQHRMPPQSPNQPNILQQPRPQQSPTHPQQRMQIQPQVQPVIHYQYRPMNQMPIQSPVPQSPVQSQTQPQIQAQSQPQMPPSQSQTQPEPLPPPPPPPPQPTPHPSIFTNSQESSIAHLKTKIPIFEEKVEYFGHDTKDVVPRDKPFSGCVFKLIEYEDVNQKLREMWCEAIRDSGGIFSENLQCLTHLICESRTSQMYRDAVKMGVRCVTIYWIDDVIAKDNMTFPWKALHLPPAFTKENPPLSDQIISITNFQGKERKELKELIKKTGAKYTDYFGPTNTLLVCRYVGGDKYERAIEWKIPTVNYHLFYEIIMTNNQSLKTLLTKAKYQIFSRDDCLKITSYGCIREIMMPWTRPVPVGTQEHPNVENLVNGDAKTTCILLNSNDDSGIVTSGSNNSDQDTTNGKFELAQCKVNGQIKPDDSKSIKMVGVKLDSDNAKSDLKIATNMGQSKISQYLPRSQRKSNSPIKVLFTHMDSCLVKKLEDCAKRLGIDFASDTSECTHLVVDRISRTANFVCAFSHADYILSYKWLVESNEANKILDEKPFMLQDREGEEKYSFNLIHSLVKRKKRGKLLLKDYIIFVTPTVLTDIVNLKEMIESAGGKMTTKKPPSRMQVDQMKRDDKHFVVVTCEEDLHLCKMFEPYGYNIVSVEFVISGILRQDIDFEAHRISGFCDQVEMAPMGSTDRTILSPHKKMKLDEPQI